MMQPHFQNNCVSSIYQLNLLLVDIVEYAKNLSTTNLLQIINDWTLAIENIEL